MFTGIIEAVGTINKVTTEGTNRIFWIQSTVSDQLKIDQSVSHNGVCLTVDALQPGQHRVTAVAETLKKTTLNHWKPGQLVNLERCLAGDGRLDGHFVQGHVDATGTCLSRADQQGSWEYRFQFPEDKAALVIEKGSIAINGVSLTCFQVSRTEFSVAIIPYTFTNTQFRELQPGDAVNLEFDMIGKYLLRHIELKAG